MRRKIMFLVVCSMLVLFCGKVFAEETVLLDFEDDKPLGAKSKFLSVPYKYCKGKTEVVAGKFGEKAVKVSFEEKTGNRSGRWCDFRRLAVKKMNLEKWFEHGSKVLKFWVKGDGSMNMVDFRIEYWKPPEKTRGWHLGTFSIENAEWTQVSILLNNSTYKKLFAANKPNFCSFQFKTRTDEELYFVIDNITVE